MIKLIITAIVVAITILCFLLIKKHPKLKSILIGVAGTLVAVSLLTTKNLTTFTKKSAEEISKSKINDKDRKKVTDKVEKQIKKNKELIDEIKKILSSNNSS